MNDRISRGDVTGRLTGKVALITGTGGGVGRATALLFARAGATVIGCGRTAESLNETQELARQEGMVIDQSVVDAADPAEARQWIDAAAERYGGVDILYNNAGFLHLAFVPDMTPEQWHETLRGEMDIAFFPSQAVWPHLIARGGGVIINISSVSGLRGLEEIGGVAHCAAKGGLEAMTRQLAMEGAKHWIRCNTITPGTIRSPGLAKHAGDPKLKRRNEASLLRRLGEGVDIAYAGLFLASDESAWVTGINLTVDGGKTSKCGYGDWSS